MCSSAQTVVRLLPEAKTTKYCRGFKVTAGNVHRWGNAGVSVKCQPCKLTALADELKISIQSDDLPSESARAPKLLAINSVITIELPDNRQRDSSDSRVSGR